MLSHSEREAVAEDFLLNADADEEEAEVLLVLVIVDHDDAVDLGADCALGSGLKLDLALDSVCLVLLERV